MLVSDGGDYSYCSPRAWGPQPPAGPAARTTAPRRPATREPARRAASYHARVDTDATMFSLQLGQFLTQPLSYPVENDRRSSTYSGWSSAAPLLLVDLAR